MTSLEAATGPEVLSAMQPRGLANVLWAAARLQRDRPVGAEGALAERQAAGGEAGPSTSGSGEAMDEAQPRLRVRGGRGRKKAAEAAAAAAATALPQRVVSEGLLQSWMAAAEQRVSERRGCAAASLWEEPVGRGCS